jgi:diketogulonate reductase-like aldo/keto reductase
MKYETILDDGRIPKIGFGTWKIGGGIHADPSQDERSLAALRSALELGYTHIDTAEGYATGHTEELLGEVIRDTGVGRESLFITTKVKPTNLHFDDVLQACAGSLRHLGTDYIDLYLVHWPNVLVPLKETFRALNQLVKEKKVRHLGVSNFDLPLLKKAQALSDTPILTDQVPYSLSDRAYVKNGVLAHCQNNNILFTAYSPVDQGRMRVNETLRAIAEAHAATPHQIALAWLVQQPKVITIPMSMDPAHQAENLAAVDILLTDDEMAQLNRLK